MDQLKLRIPQVEIDEVKTVVRYEHHETVIACYDFPKVKLEVG